MLNTFQDMRALIAPHTPVTIVVASADDRAVLETVKMAIEGGFVRAILAGKGIEIRRLCREIGLHDPEIIDASEEEVCFAAIQAVRDGRAQVLMKGLVNTSTFLRAVLNKERGLYDNRLLSLIAAYELPFYHKLIFCADSGINIAPDIAKKTQILLQSLAFLKDIGYEAPRVALLTANEMYDPKVAASADARTISLMDFSAHGLSPLVEGPISLDIAFDQQAALHKGVDSRISGNVDFLLFPNIESGNFLGKSWLMFNNAKWASLVLGARVPIILGSRSDSPEVKLNSILMACLAMQDFAHASVT